MCCSITKSGSIKKILLATSYITLGLQSQTLLAQVTTSWTGDGLGNVWTRGANWNNLIPGTGSIALIQSGGSGANLFLREGTSGSVNAGTIIFNHNGYRNIVAGTGGASATTVNFGTSAGIDADITPPQKGTGEGPGQIGDYSGTTPKSNGDSHRF